MYDSGKIIPGLAVFVLLITFPIWYNNFIGDAGAVQSAKYNTIAESHEAFEAMLQGMGIKFPNGARHSLSTQEMRATHMNVLQRIHTTAKNYVPGKDEKKPTMSCLTCHSGSAEQPLEVCNKCHASASVKTPDCWSCHTKP